MDGLTLIFMLFSLALLVGCIILFIKYKKTKDFKDNSIKEQLDQLKSYEQSLNEKSNQLEKDQELFKLDQKKLIDSQNEWNEISNNKQKELDKLLEEKRLNIEKQIEQKQTDFENSLNNKRKEFEEQNKIKQEEFDKSTKEKEKAFEESLNNKRKEFEEQNKAKQETFDKQFNEKSDKLTQEFADKQTKLTVEYQKLEEDSNNKIKDINDKLHYYEDLYNKVVQDQINREKDEKQREFYKIQINDIERSDISKLHPIAEQISKPLLVYQLIYTYYYKEKLETTFNKIVSQYELKSGIYKITNLFDNKVYIGKAKNIVNRWKEHAKEGCNYKSAERSEDKLYKAMQIEGIDNFTFEVIDSCEENLLDEREKYWISFYHATEIGYNSKVG